MPTLEDLLDQQAELNIALATHEKPLIENAIEILSGEEALIIRTVLDGVLAKLPENNAKLHVRNMLSMFTAVPQILQGELVRVNGLLNPPMQMPYPMPGPVYTFVEAEGGSGNA